MKEWLTLYKNILNRYSADKLSPLSRLYDLYRFISTDYLTCHAWDVELFTKPVRALNFTYIVNDLENKIAYIGVHHDDPEDSFFQEEGSEKINETNSCKINHDNFEEFIKKWFEIKKALPPFAIIYRDDHDWIHCKGFQTKEKMELFIKSYQPEDVH